MPVNRPAANLQAGVALGPGTFSLPEASAAGATARYELGERRADPSLNGDGLHLSAEARVRAGARGAASLEHVRLRAGVEGVEAKLRVVKNGEGDMAFEGISLKDGYVKDRLDAGKEWLEDRPVAAGAAVVGALVVGHEVAKRRGPIAFDTGSIELYEKNGFTAKVKGELELTGDSRFIRGRGVKGQVAYEERSVGRMALEGAYDVDRGPRASATWSKRFDSGVEAHASASWDREETRAFVGMSYRW